MLTLPVELIHKVIDHLCAQDLINLQSTCRDLRAILIAKLWRHVNLQCSSQSWKQISMQHYIGEDHHCKPRSFYHKHTCKKGGYVSCDVDSNMRQFARAILRGDFDLAYEWVRILTLVTPFFTRGASESTCQVTLANVDSVDMDCLVSWLLTQLVPNKLTNLRLIEVLVEYGGVSTGETTTPVLQKLLEHFPDVETNINVHLNRNWQSSAGLSTLSFGNIKILRIQCDGLEDVQQLCGPYLPESIERFDLVDYNELQATNLKQFFSKCAKLQSVSLKWGNVNNPQSINWLPDTVTNLQMSQFRDSSAQEQQPVQAMNVTCFKSYTRMGQVFHSIKFPNLERLSVQGPVDNEQPLIDSVTTAFNTSPHIRQLKCRRLRVDFVAAVFQAQLHSYRSKDSGIRSLIVQPGATSTRISFSEYCRLATKLRDLDSLVITLSSLSQSETVRFLRKVLSFCPGIKQIYIEHLFIKPESWAVKTGQPYVFDDFSRIRVDANWCYEVDIDEFRRLHLPQPDQNRIRACAVRNSEHEVMNSVTVC